MIEIYIFILPFKHMFLNEHKKLDIYTLIHLPGRFQTYQNLNPGKTGSKYSFSAQESDSRKLGLG